MSMIYLDSAATSYYRPDEVAEAVAQAIRTMGNCSRGTYETALESARVILQTRQLVDELFDGYGPDQVAFTANSTESLNMAIKGVLKPGDRAVTTVLEHNSVLRPLYQLEEQGVLVTRVGCLKESWENIQGSQKMQEKQPDIRGSRENQPDIRGSRKNQPDTEEPWKIRRGLLDMEQLRQAIVPGVKAVILTHGSNLTGNIQDIRTVGQWCQKAGAVFIVDASQTGGVFPISMKKDGIDILCFTGHKGLMGPQGTGGLCVRRGLKIAPLLSGGSGIQTYSKRHPLEMPVALEAGTLNGHGIAGLRAALQWIKEHGGTEPIRRKEEELARLFYHLVKEIPGIRFYGDYESYERAGKGDGKDMQKSQSCRNPGMEGEVRPRAAMVTLNLGDEDSGEVSDWLASEHGIYTRSGGHCAPLMHEALGTREQGAVRFSFSCFNTEEEVRQAARALREYF